jgi:hypothetical protein
MKKFNPCRDERKIPLAFGTDGERILASSPLGLQLP